MKLRFALAVMALCAVGGVHAMQEGDAPVNDGGDNNGWQFTWTDWFKSGCNRDQGIKHNLATWSPFTKPTEMDPVQRQQQSFENQGLLLKGIGFFFATKFIYNYFTSSAVTKKKKKKRELIQ